MRRALAISLLFHLLVWASLIDFRLLPPLSAPFVGAAARLTVDLNSVQAQRGIVSEQRGPLARMTSSKAHAHSAAVGERPRTGGLEHSISLTKRLPLPPIPQDDVPNGLPADIESEYRLNIARELRKTGYFSQRKDGNFPGGVAHLSISYRAGLTMPVVSLDRSSGHSEFDAVALAGLSAALARAQLPGSATGLSFKMSFVLDYGPVRQAD
jgi:hypothetical protein